MMKILMRGSISIEKNNNTFNVDYNFTANSIEEGFLKLKKIEKAIRR